MTEPEQHYEPPAKERVYYRNRDTADRGYLVRREGKRAIRYDRPAIDQYTFNLEDWAVEAEDAERFTAIQIAKVCFEADKALCWAMGEMKLAKREWMDLTDKARKKWMEDGPSDATRAAVYRAIVNVMKGSK